eukprot:TRINITY_DN2019_c0_g1_i1.p1 TRINITY_DN2019_c0_g1~~TRINITY_DN2019_c0_g1_i1.p1  ORF type:complete len:468 (+),score=161.60 TRINITY_DN2019_c0_g1_i1:381-1784(+)
MHSVPASSTPTQAAFYMRQEERWVLVGPSSLALEAKVGRGSFASTALMDSETDGSLTDDASYEDSPDCSSGRTLLHPRPRMLQLDSLDAARVSSSYTTGVECDEVVNFATPVMSPLCGALRVTPCYISPNKALVRTDTNGAALDGLCGEGVGKGMTKSQSLDNIIDMVCAAEQAVREETLPELTLEGTGGVYFVSDASGGKVGVYKPSDEEVSSQANPRGCTEVLKKTIPPGEGWKREIAAYRLDHGHFAGVPETFQMRMPRSYFQSAEDKVGSFQRFVPSYAESWDVLPNVLPVEDIHRIAILDIRLCNSDRHGGNVLVVKEEADDVAERLVPIDHGCCFPTDLSELEFEWLLWSQSKAPLSPESLDYIRRLDAAQDARILKDELGIAPICADYVHVATRLLQIAAEAGLTLRHVGLMMRRPQLDALSELETAVAGEMRGDGRIDVDGVEPLLMQMVRRAAEPNDT